MLNLLLNAQQTESLLYSNPLIGGNESVWMLERSKEGFLVCSPGICLPSTNGCTSFRNYSNDNNLLWETFFDSIGPGSFDGIKYKSNITYLTLWYKTIIKDQDFLYKLDSSGNIMNIVQIDEDTINNGTVTIRDRDTMEQTTVKVEELTKYIEDRIKF